jgi:hypothetical protein
VETSCLAGNFCFDKLPAFIPVLPSSVAKWIQDTVSQHKQTQSTHKLDEPTNKVKKFVWHGSLVRFAKGSSASIIKNKYGCTSVYDERAWKWLLCNQLEYDTMFVIILVAVHLASISSHNSCMELLIKDEAQQTGIITSSTTWAHLMVYYYLSWEPSQNFDLLQQPTNIWSS